jgi:outer membrane protein TolC
VSDLLSALQNDARAVAMQTEAADVARRSLQLSRRSFEVGNSGILQVLDSERLYQRASADLVMARSAQFVNVARLYVATAGGWTSRR